MLFLEQCTQKKLYSFKVFLNTCQDMFKKALSNKSLQENSTYLHSAYMLIAHPEQHAASWATFLRGVQKIRHSRNLIANFGTLAYLYSLLPSIKNELSVIMLAASELDVYHTTASLITENKPNVPGWSFVTFTTQQTPFIHARDLWNVFIPQDKAISNTTALNCQNTPRVMILTGPNAGGKSTILRSYGHLITMAQSIGIAPVSECSMTIMHHVITHLNINDDIAAGNSLFKAEVLRSKSIIDLVEHSASLHQFSFIIMDELFNGTTPLEGEAAAYGFVSHIAQQEHILATIATHFEKMTYLEKSMQSCKNFHMGMHVENGKNPVYTFKINPGKSPYHVALNILQAANVPPIIIDKAKNILANQMSA